jgi:hypothetical protein
MPKYTWKCSECGNTKSAYSSSIIKTIECEDCDGKMKRQLPSLRGVKTTETVDKFFNKRHVDDQKNILQERKLDYYWEVEVPKMVNSGTYELSTMLEQGWVYYDEKGNLVTRTKPPQKS